MPIFIKDPLDFFNQRDREQARLLAQLPACQRCGDAIQQEMAVCIEGFWYCDECLEWYKREVIPNG